MPDVLALVVACTALAVNTTALLVIRKWSQQANRDARRAEHATERALHSLRTARNKT